jgi:hypothetical protein
MKKGAPSERNPEESMALYKALYRGIKRDQRAIEQEA